MSETEANGAQAARHVTTGHNPAALFHGTAALILDVIARCECKILYRDNEGQHCERRLGTGIRRTDVKGTYCVMNLEAQAVDLSRRLTPLGLDSDAIDRVNLYVSPPRSGAPLHFDTRTAIIVQLAGRKLWQVADTPAVARPTRNVLADEIAGTARHEAELLYLPDRMRFAYLSPGDWLAIPRATWHGTYSRIGSVSATLAFAENTSPDLTPLTKAPGVTLPLQGWRLVC